MNHETRAKLSEVLDLLEQEAGVNVSDMSTTEFVNQDGDAVSCEMEFTVFYPHEREDAEVEVEVQPTPRNYQ